MKKIFTAISLFICSTAIGQNMEISTLRIGDFKIYMNAEDAITIAKKKLVLPTEQNKYENLTTVKYNNELVYLTLSENYYDEQTKGKYIIVNLSTKSDKFKTKSGIGIGSTRDEIINAYRNYTSFEMYPNWGATDEKPKPGDCIFTLNDLEANTALSFVMKNNIVIEVRIYINEGC